MCMMCVQGSKIKRKRTLPFQNMRRIRPFFSRCKSVYSQYNKSLKLFRDSCPHLQRQVQNEKIISKHAIYTKYLQRGIIYKDTGLNLVNPPGNPYDLSTVVNPVCPAQRVLVFDNPRIRGTRIMSGLNWQRQ